MDVDIADGGDEGESTREVRVRGKERRECVGHWTRLNP